LPGIGHITIRILVQLHYASSIEPLQLLLLMVLLAIDVGLWFNGKLNGKLSGTLIKLHG